METQGRKQQTMSEFLAPSKSSRVWLIIMAALVSLMIIGAAYEYNKPKSDPVRMSTQLSSGTYSYLDVSLVSNWLLKVTGDNNYTLYEAMDSDGNWFLITLDDGAYAKLSVQKDAYDVYYSADSQNFVLPDPVRLTGVTHVLDSDDAQQIASIFDNTTSSQITGFYGTNYFNEGANNQGDGVWAYVMGIIFFGMFFLILVINTSAVRKNYRRSESRLYELGMTDEAEAEYSAPESIRYPKSKLILSKQFIYCGMSGWVVPYEDIGWAYQRTQRGYGIPISKQIIAGLNNGKTVVLTAKGVNDSVLTETARAIYS
ncbi:MAG: hypothetical protein PHW41_08415, partial [Eubacteriales bacterium]|nr:hypothetical protein [Eubacteriales bacterium]